MRTMPPAKLAGVLRTANWLYTVPTKLAGVMSPTQEPGAALVLAQKLQNETVPELRLLPEGGVAGLGHGHKLAIGDMRR
jgi:hypothetical protein